jgi:putative ATP-binding cassette transporter
MGRDRDAPQREDTPDGLRPGAPVFDRRFLGHLSRLIGLYWRAPDARWGALLLTLAVAFELGTVWGNLLVADAERRILDALAVKDASAFLAAIVTFLGVTLVFLVSSAYRIYMRQSLEIRWRRALTADYVDRWISHETYLQPELHPGAVDNPDQRIQEDVRDFVASALGLSLSLMAAVATLVSFGGLLWSLSAGFPLHLGATTLRIPGLMLWVAVAYGLLSMWVTHLAGRRLVPINFDRLHFEANMRYGLMRFRDSAEVVALSRGEEVERRLALERFGDIVRNWWALIRAQRNLTLLTGGIASANSVVPVLVAVPGYLTGAITLGTIVQIRIAYAQVSAALAWFVYAYQEIARWRANVERLGTLSEVMDATEQTCADSGIRLVSSEPGALRLAGLRVEEPNGRVLLDGADATVLAGDRVVVSGASGTGKTLLLRAIAGIWPFGGGRIEVPAGRRMLFVAQWPYIPVGTLRAAVSYPSRDDVFSDERIAESLRLLDLERLSSRLDDVEHWDQRLSPHEQQRLAFARVLLHEPEWILLDKATSALDEQSEQELYDLLALRLPAATVVSVAHRPGVERYHTRRWTLTARDGHVTLEAA